MSIDPTSSVSDVDPPKRTLKDLPLIRTSLDKPLPEIRPSKSRPNEVIQQNGKPRPPLSIQQKPAASPPPRMSLFNLFNRPKVEKTRGYVEPGLAAPLARRASKTASIAHVRASDASPPRSTTALSFRSHQRFKPQKKLPTPPPKSGNWEAPPLSQAYPQAIKFGTAQTSSADGASVLRIQRTRKNGSLQVPTPEFTPTTSEELRESGELKRNARLQTHNFTSSSSNPELPRKIFVLCTTGHILQYSARGPSDRYPDKVLLLSKESAAFACDLVLGKPYVLQIAQSVDGQGAPLAASPTSLFARMGLKSASSRRATPSMLLVLESAAEMDAWMVAVRKQIEVCGGKRGVRPDAAVGHKTEETVETFSKRSETPTHRYQVRRDPKRISVIASPIGDAGKEEQVVPLEVPEKNHRRENSRNYSCPAMTNTNSMSVASRYSRARNGSEATSVASTIMTSPRSVRDSMQTTRSSVATARTSISSRPSLPDLKADQNGTRELKSSYRYPTSTSGSRRRSTLSQATTQEVPLSPALDVEADVPLAMSSSPEDSLERSPVKSPIRSPVAATVNIRQSRALHSDSPPSSGRLRTSNSMPSITLTAVYETSQPDSFIADLPLQSNYTTRGPVRKPPPLPIKAVRPVQRAASQTSPRTAEPLNPRRHSSMPFSLPLKVNPTILTQQSNHPLAQRSAYTLLHASAVPTSSRSPLERPKTSHNPSPASSVDVTPPNEQAMTALPTLTQSHNRRTSAQKLSLFPTSFPPPSASVPQTPSPHSQTQGLYANRALRRPASLQVRSDPAPFLSGIRARSASNLRAMEHATMATTSVNSSSLQTTNRTDAYLSAILTVPSPVIPPADADVAKDILSALPAQAPRKSLISRTSLPVFDLGLPVVGLGPPAPPPSLPLPQVPSRPSTPACEVGA